MKNCQSKECFSYTYLIVYVCSLLFFGNTCVYLVAYGCNFQSLEAHFHSRKISTDRKFSENIVKSSNFFSDVKFVSANHILQNFLSAENFPE
jgi:hypothetical protein